MSILHKSLCLILNDIASSRTVVFDDKIRKNVELVWFKILSSYCRVVPQFKAIC